MTDYMWHLHFKCECGENVVFSRPCEGNKTRWHCHCGKNWQIHVKEYISRKAQAEKKVMEDGK